MQSIGFYPRTLWLQTWLCLLLTFMSTWVSADTRQPVWHVVSLTGAVEWKSETVPSWQPLKEGQSLTVPMHVRSLGGRATLVQGQDKVMLSPNSELFFPAPEPDSIFTRILQSIGVVKYEVGKRAQPGFEVATPHLTSLVKGTRFEVATSSEGATVSLTEGSLQVSTADKQQNVLLKPMQSASVSLKKPEIEVISLVLQGSHSGSGRTGESAMKQSQSSSALTMSTFSWAEQLGLGTAVTTPTLVEDGDQLFQSLGDVITSLQDSILDDGILLINDAGLPLETVESLDALVTGNLIGGSGSGSETNVDIQLNMDDISGIEDSLSSIGVDVGELDGLTEDEIQNLLEDIGLGDIIGGGLGL